MMQTFIDLFAGIGGFHIALEARGLDCVFASEIDADAQQAYEANFGFKPHGDITTIDAGDIPAHDVLCAGFPCQPFSITGNRGGVADARGMLFYQIIRIAEHHKPQAIILENVKQVLTIDGGQVKQTIYDSLDKIGYKVFHAVLNSGDFGVPQQRHRVFFVAIRKDAGLLFNTPMAVNKHTCVNDIILNDAFTYGQVVNRSDIVFDKSQEQSVQGNPIRIGWVRKLMQGYRIYHANGHAITQTANGGGLGRQTGLYHINGRVRRLHIDEMKAVMGFDKNHIIGLGNAGYKQLGNAVVPAVIKAVFDGITKQEAGK